MKTKMKKRKARNYRIFEWTRVLFTGIASCKDTDESFDV